MKVTIAFMLVALSYCLSTSSSYILPQMETMMSEEDAYFYRRMTEHLMCRYQEASECEEGPDRDFKMKCTLSDIFHIVGEMAEKLGCSMEEILCEMGVSDITIEEMQDIISGEGSVDDLSSEECENFIIGILRGLFKMVLDLIRPYTGILEGILADGPLGGLLSSIPLDALTGVIGGVAGAAAGVMESVPLDILSGTAEEAIEAATAIVGDSPLKAVTEMAEEALEVVTDALEILPLEVGNDIVGEVVGLASDVLGDLPLGMENEIDLAVPLEIASSLMGNEDALGPLGDVVEVAQVSETLTILGGDELLGGGTQVLGSLDIMEGITGQLNTERLLETPTGGLEITQGLTGSLEVAGVSGLLPGAEVGGITSVLSAANISPEGLVPPVGGLLSGGGLNKKSGGFGNLGFGAKGLNGGKQKAVKNGLPRKGLLG